MAKTISFISILLLVLLPSCNSKKNQQSESERLIRLGSGGGITGAYEGYMLGEKGRVYQWEQSAGSEFSARIVGRTTKDSAGRYFLRLDAIEFRDMNIHQSGNFNQFIELSEKDTVYKNTWTNTDKIPASLYLFYKDLEAFLKAKSHPSDED